MENAIEPSAPFSREQLAGYKQSILDTRLLLLGAGALGESLALQLTKWGFRRATIVDFDRYDPSNATRTLDFPHGAVRRGRPPLKASHLAARWRRRLVAAGGSPEIAAVEGYLQELDPALWSSADVVLAAVDHPRARYDLAVLARRYGKPVIMGGFDAQSRACTVHALSPAPEEPCYACTLASEPGYAASETSCRVFGQRELEQRKVPATPTLASACAALMTQRLVDHAMGYAPAGSRTLLQRLVPTDDGSLGHAYTPVRDPDCPHHLAGEPLALALRGERLGGIARSLEALRPGARIVLSAPTPVHAVASDHVTLVSLKRPPWRCPIEPDAADYPAAPDGAYVVQVAALDVATCEAFGLGGLPGRWFGLRPGARFLLEAPDGSRRLAEWR